jgi:hypothetical protein
MTTASDPAAAPVLPPVSQPFVCPDDAACWLHQHERRADKEYGALILQRPDGKFVATSPTAGEADAFDFERLLGFDRSTQTIIHPPGYRCVGLHHSHPEHEREIARMYPHYRADQVKLHITLPSTVDLALAFRQAPVLRQLYLSSPYGSLIGYAIDPKHTSRSPAYGMGSTPESRIRRIVTIGRLWVLHPGTVWGGRRGRVTADWVPFQPLTPGPADLAPS